MFQFIRLEERHLELVLRWRTSESVTRYMFTDVEYNIDRQKQWFDRIKGSDTEKYWIIKMRGDLIGLISLNGLDYPNKRTSWGFYIGEEKYRMYGGLIPPYLYNFVFNQLNFNKITAEVMEGNDNVTKMHRMHGYREVGICKEHVYKYGRYHDTYVLELLKERWESVSDKYKKYIAPFQIK